MTEQAMIQLAMNEGFSAAAIIPTDRIIFDPAFRPYCKENLCGQYGVNYSCPPDCGSVDEMAARITGRGRAMVFQTKWDITDYGDKAYIKEAKAFHNSAMLRVIDQLRADGHNGVMAGASGCSLCTRCALVDGEACRFPDRYWSCLSAYCIFVRLLAEEAGMEYSCEDGSLAFFGLYAF